MINFPLLRTMRRMDDYFDNWAEGALCKTDYNLHDMAELQEAGDVYACKKCGALVLEDGNTKHIAEHKMMEELLALAHQLTEAVRRIETMAQQTRRA